MDLLKNSEAHLRDYWEILVRRRWIVFATVVLVLLSTLVGSILTRSSYRATATLQIDRQNPDILTFQDLSRMDYSYAAYSDFYATQYKLLASEPVARKAAERLGLVAHPEFLAASGERSLFSKVYGTLIGWLPKRSHPVELEPVDIAAAGVLSALEVDPIRDSQLVQVSWVSSDPELAAEVANAVADAFIGFNLESLHSTSGEARDFLVNQVAELKEEIAEIEARLQDYGESKGIVRIDDANNLTFQALKDISERRTEAETALALAQARYLSVTEAAPEALPEVLSSTLIARLREEFASYEVDYTEKSKIFKNDWPGMQTLGSKVEQARLRLELEIDTIATQVRATAEAEYSRAKSEVENLDRLLTRQQNLAQTQKRDAIEYNSLQSEVGKKRETLDALIQRQNEMALSTRLKDMDSSSSNIRVVERAKVPPVPFRPNFPRNLLLGLLCGMSVGVGFAFFLDYLDNTIGSGDQLEQITAFPVLALIPRHAEAGAPRGRRKGEVQSGKGIDLVAHRDGRASVSEAYRELRTSILLSSAGRPPRCIMVTSALPEEGKTATAVNLATVLAQTGRRVLLIDTDLRRPRLHKVFGCTNNPGASTYISGQISDVSRLTRRTEVPGLDLLASGPIPPNPSELLNSTVFPKLAEDLYAAGYEHLVFDSPPVLSVSDALLIARISDTNVMVVRARRTPRQSARFAAEKLRQANVSNAGVVLNDLDLSGKTGDYYRYAYYESHESEETGGDWRPTEGASRNELSGTG